MGIFGALTSAISGLRAQSFALQHISDNIANSQTIGFKRTETSFIDVVSGVSAPRSHQGGTVIGNSRATNTIQGDVISSAVSTHVAINGNGYFVVEKPVGFNDGNAVFAGVDQFTRRGDFAINKDGYLVNGAGYFLQGLPVDPATGNVSGTLPQPIQVSNDFLPARATTTIDYRANLARIPSTVNYTTTVPNSELLNPTGFTNVPTTGSSYTGTIDLSGFTDLTTVAGIADGDQFTVAAGGAGPFTITIDAGDSPADIAAEITAAFVGGEVSASITAEGYLKIVSNNGSPVQLADATNSPVADLGLPDGTVTGTVIATDVGSFLDSSVAGGAITAFDEAGSPVNIQLRWAKIDSAQNGGSDTWNLFYLENSAATGTDVAWRNVGADYVFGANGALQSPPAPASVDIPSLTVNGVSLANISLEHGTAGLTQFSDATGVARVTDIDQDGYATGELAGVSISDAGRIVGVYSNGQSLDLAEIAVATFNADDFLKKLDGGAFESTPESGAALLGLQGRLVSQALEGSNADIADEFAKLIVTQQAYTAATRIVTTSDEMLQEAVNMVR
jgi:flagellar hook protein FlgE